MRQAESVGTRSRRHAASYYPFDRRDFSAEHRTCTGRRTVRFCRRAHAQAANTPTPNGTSTDRQPSSFGALKQINAGELNVGYAEAGPSDGPVALLLHGWPYDIHSFVDVAPLLSAKGTA